MRKKETKLILAAALAASAMLFTACGGSAQQTTAAQTTAAAAETTAAAAAAETTAAGETAAAGETSAAAETTPAETLPAKPESLGTVTLGSYKGIELTEHKIDVTDEEVDAYIQSVLDYVSSTQEVGRAAKEGDTVNIDYVGKKDGVAFDGGTAAGYDLTLGSGSFIDGFEDGLIGVEKGDKVTLSLTFPEEYHAEDLAGQDVTFDVTVNAVKEPKKQELTDEWVAEYTKGAQKTVAEYKAETKKQLEDQYKQSAYTADVTNAIQAVIDDSQFTLDPAAVAYETAIQTRQQQAYLTQYGVDLDSYLSMTGMSREDYDAQMQKVGEESVKTQLVIKEVAAKEDLKIGSADYKKLEQMTGYAKDLLIQYYGQEQVDADTLYLKVADFLIDNAVRTEAPAETTAAAEETAAETETKAEAETTAEAETKAEETTAAQ